MADEQVGQQQFRNGDVIVAGSDADIISCGKGPVQLSIDTVREKLEQNKGMKPEDVVLLEDKTGHAYFVTVSELATADARHTAAAQQEAEAKKPHGHGVKHGHQGAHAHAGHAGHAGHGHSGTAHGEANIGKVTAGAEHPSKISSFLSGLSQTYVDPATGRAVAMKSDLAAKQGMHLLTPGGSQDESTRTAAIDHTLDEIRKNPGASSSKGTRVAAAPPAPGAPRKG
jgi:hypothetical protein